MGGISKNQSAINATGLFCFLSRSRDSIIQRIDNHCSPAPIVDVKQPGH